MNSGYHKNLVFTAACIGMCFFGVSMITLGSVLPSLVTKLELSGLQTTSLVTFLPIGMLAGSLIFGPIADRFGHKALLVPSCIIVCQLSSRMKKKVNGLMQVLTIAAKFWQML